MWRVRLWGRFPALMDSRLTTGHSPRRLADFRTLARSGFDPNRTISQRLYRLFLYGSAGQQSGYLLRPGTRTLNLRHGPCRSGLRRLFVVAAARARKTPRMVKVCGRWKARPATEATVEPPATVNWNQGAKILDERWASIGQDDGAFEASRPKNLEAAGNSLAISPPSGPPPPPIKNRRKPKRRQGVIPTPRSSEAAGTRTQDQQIKSPDEPEE